MANIIAKIEVTMADVVKKAIESIEPVEIAPAQYVEGFNDCKEIILAVIHKITEAQDDESGRESGSPDGRSPEESGEENP